MPLISRIGRRSPRVRLLLGLIYLALISGTVTMLYPFLLMVAGSTKSAVDAADHRLIPAYLVDDDALYRKYIEALFNESIVSYQTAMGASASSFRQVQPPQPAETSPTLIEDWARFLETVPLPTEASCMGHFRAERSRGAQPRLLRAFKKVLQDRYAGNILDLNQQLGTAFPDWNALYALQLDALPRQNKPNVSPLAETVEAFEAQTDPQDRYYVSPDAFYRYYLRTQYAQDIEAFNTEHGTHYPDWSAVHLDRRRPTGIGRTAREQTTWTSFVRDLLHLAWVRVGPEATPAYQAYLAAKYGSIDRLNTRYGTHYPNFVGIPIVDAPPRKGLPRSDWEAFIVGWKDPDSGMLHQAGADQLSIYSVDFLFRDTMRERYPDLEAMNLALGTAYTSWTALTPPQEAWQHREFLQQRGALRREFTVRNFISVYDFVIRHGRAVRNTAIYCLLAVLSALLVNPLAAYALSRFRPPSTYKLLLLMMLTMAFPPMVTQIPAFLLLRDLGLLNTFWALVLPGVAHGYWIFLLKGFFDAQPRELYECAALDGAGEFRIFWQIAMNLSKPVLAVIALNAFTVAYANFMMALLICQDPDMWTLMPWLYQLQQRSGPGIIYASLLIAAVPTFLVFAFCQNVIMRGIVVPVEK